MKHKYIKSLIATISILSICSCSKKDELFVCKECSIDHNVDKSFVDVIILAGQSNAVGCALNESLNKYISEQEKSLYTNGIDHVYINCNEEHGAKYGFKPLTYGFGASINNFGPEIGLGKTIYDIENRSRDTYIIKYAVGAMSLHSDFTSPSYNGVVGPCYYKLINHCYKSLYDLKQLGLNPVVKSFCWAQGGSDCKNYAKEYYNLEKCFFQDIEYAFKDYTSDNCIQFFDYGAYLNCPLLENYKQLNDSKIKVSKLKSNYHYIDSIENNLTCGTEPSILGSSENDPIHLDSKSIFKLGQLFAQGIIDLDWLY